MKSLKKHHFLLLPFCILFLLGIVLLFNSCDPIHGSVINEIPPLNGNLSDQATPTAMCEDENYFYVLMNMPWRATKKLSYPENYNPGKTKVDANPNTPEYEPLPSDDARMIPEWEVLDRFQTTHTFSPNAISCRSIVNFKDTIYASFCDESLRYQNNTQFDNYNFILKLNDDGVWVDSTIPIPPLESPALNETDPSKIDINNHRLFGYLEDLEHYAKNINDLSEDERNGYEVAQKFYTNQIRKIEASTFYVIDEQLYILFSDVHIRDYNLSSPVKFASSPLMQLYRVDNIESSPTLVQLSYNRMLEPSIYKSESELLQLIKDRMGNFNENYLVARGKVIISTLYAKSSQGESEWLKVYTKENNSWQSTSYTKIAHHYRSNTIASYPSKAYLQESPKAILFFSKDGIFQLQDGASPSLINITEKLPYGIQIDSQVTTNAISLIDINTSLPSTQEEEDLLKKRFYTRYKINDFYTYKHPVSGLQHSLIITAMLNKIDGTKRYDIWSYTGNILNATYTSWELQTIEGSNIIKSDKKGIQKSKILMPTSFVFYTNEAFPMVENYPISSNRTIHQLLLGTNRGFYTADPDPQTTQTKTPFSSTSSTNAEKLNYCYDKNISTITISSSHISGFYPTVAIVDEIKVPVLFVFTAGNGLWLNYNRYFNIE